MGKGNYDYLLKHKHDAFTFFLNCQPDLFDESDIKRREKLCKNFRLRAIAADICGIIGSVLFLVYLRQRNFIFNLARRESSWEFFKKYVIIPSVVAHSFRPFNDIHFNNELTKIVDKYDFNQPIFREAFDKFLESYFQKQQEKK